MNYLTTTRPNTLADWFFLPFYFHGFLICFPYFSTFPYIKRCSSAGTKVSRIIFKSRFFSVDSLCHA